LVTIFLGGHFDNDYCLRRRSNIGLPIAGKILSRGSVMCGD
jgi:hypothetical protein